MKRRLGLIGATVAATLAVTALPSVGMAAPQPGPPSTASAVAAQPTSSTTDPAASIPPARRSAVLGRKWQSSTDTAWTTSGDASGFHVLTARQRDGYAWKTIATLSEPGIDTSGWIGNACVTGSGRYAVVVYAPKEFNNSASFVDRGAFTAIVDLRSGRVAKMAINASLAYFDPGCGIGDQAVITQSDNESSVVQTRLQLLDVAHGKVASTVTVRGQVTSAIPRSGGIVAVQGHRLVAISPTGRVTTLAETKGTAFRLHADGSASNPGVTYLETDGRKESVRHLVGQTSTALAQGTLGQFGLSSGASGHVYVTGSPLVKGKLPVSLSASNAPAGSETSLQGGLAVTSTAPKSLADASARGGRGGLTRAAIASSTALRPVHGADSSAPEPVVINAVATASRTGVTFTASGEVVTAAGTASGGSRPSPLLRFLVTGAAAVKTATTRSTRTATAYDNSNDPVDENATCSVPRNDPSTMVYQPTPNQVEWAADLAVRGLLTSANINRPANWKDSGLPAWSPQGMFPLTALSGGGRIPAQVLLGILAQESNLWQASSHAQPGEYGNPLVGNFYGANLYPGTTGYDPNLIWQINWANADCGYGIGQVTDGMRLAGKTKPGETALPATEQRALAMDYATNIAYSAQILASKWNELQNSNPPILMNNDSASKIENWFAAVWDYNSGFNAPGSDPSGAWGLGWLNNPANPIYPADRAPFLDGKISCPATPGTLYGYANCASNVNLTDGPSYADAAHPQYWPYEEKVVGWAMAPIDTGRSYDDNGVQNTGNTAGYSAAWWSSDYQRVTAKPPLTAFCNTNNACDVSNPPPCETQHIVGCDVLHWYNHPVTWKSDCSTSCGHEYMTYQTLRAEPGDAKPSPINCGPVGSTVIGSISASVPEPACPSGGQQWTDGGTFSFSFPVDSNGQYEAKEDLHQVSTGFAGHYWFSHGRQNGNWNNLLETTGTWTTSGLPAGSLGSSDIPSHMYQVEAHMPYLGNMTHTATYAIYDGAGHSYTQTVDQSSAENGWLTIGTYALGPGAKVVLTNITSDPTSGDTTVAYDAMMFVPYTGTSPMVISMPAAATNAPVLDYTGEGQREFVSNQQSVNVQYPSTVLSKMATRSSGQDQVAPKGFTCADLGKKPGVYHCPLPATKSRNVSPPLTSHGIKSSRVSPALTPDTTNYANDIPNWCGATAEFTRFETCQMGDLSYSFVNTQNGAIVGTAMFQIKQEVMLDAKRTTFDEWMWITPLNIDPAVGALGITWTASCSGACTDSPTGVDWQGVNTWGVDDTHIAIAHTTHTWNAVNPLDELSLKWTADVNSSLSFVGSPAVWSSSPNSEIRCDQVATAGQGCVFDKYIPGLEINTDADPVPAASTWVLEQQLKNHPGSRLNNSPLHRGDQSVVKANRAAICDSSYTTRWGASDVMQCDEYPFAQSEESGAQMGISSGAQCAQLAAWPVPNSSAYNSWELTWDQAYPYPQSNPWGLACGRTRTPGDQNMGVGGDYGRFVQGQRLMPANQSASPATHGDPFFVDVPGFDSCTNNSTCAISALPTLP